MFSVTIAYLKENSEIKDKFLKEILTQKSEIKDKFLKEILTQKYEKHSFGSKMGGRLIHWIDLYTGKYGRFPWQNNTLRQKW